MLIRYAFGLGVISLCSALVPTSAYAAQVATGSFAGDGADDRSITGLGFQPDVVFIQADGAPNGVWRSTTMPVDSGAPFGSAAYQSDTIQQFESDGFQVGSDNRVNKSGTIYYWFALEAVSGEGVVAEYIGDGTDSRSITGIGFQPDYVLISGDVSSNPFQRFLDLVGDISLRITGGSAANRIQAFESDGFQVGGNDAVNQSGKEYDAIAWKNTSDSFATGSFTGDGTDDRSITGLGFQPDVLLVKSETTQPGVFRTAAHSGDSTSVFNATNSADLIQALESDGFQVGTNNKVNQSGKAIYWAAWKHVEPVPDPTPTPEPDPTPTPEPDPPPSTSGSSSSGSGSSDSEASSSNTGLVSTPTPSPKKIASPVPIPTTPPTSTTAFGGAGQTVVLATPTSTPTPTLSPSPAPIAEPLVPSSTGNDQAQSNLGPITVGRVAGVFTTSLVNVAWAAAELPVEMQPVAHGLRWVDGALITIGVAALLALVACVGYLFGLSHRHTATGKGLSLAVVGPQSDLGAHFARHVGRGQQGEMLMPFTTWKRLVALQKRCWHAFFAVLAGKAAIAVVITIAFLVVTGL